jgi:hypothetical protein
VRWCGVVCRAVLCEFEFVFLRDVVVLTHSAYRVCWACLAAPPHHRRVVCVYMGRRGGWTHFRPCVES